MDLCNWNLKPMNAYACGEKKKKLSLTKSTSWFCLFLRSKKSEMSNFLPFYVIKLTRFRDPLQYNGFLAK